MFKNLAPEHLIQLVNAWKNNSFDGKPSLSFVLTRLATSRLLLCSLECVNYLLLSGIVLLVVDIEGQIKAIVFLVEAHPAVLLSFDQ